jgi:hypothetical protein
MRTIYGFLIDLLFIIDYMLELGYEKILAKTAVPKQ